MHEFPSAVEILKVFERDPARSFGLRELVVALGLRSSQARQLKLALKELSRKRKIVYLRKSRFALPREVAAHRGQRPPAAHTVPSAAAREGRPPVTGRLIGHRDGYGFV